MKIKLRKLTQATSKYGIPSNAYIAHGNETTTINPSMLVPYGSTKESISRAIKTMRQ